MIDIIGIGEALIEFAEEGQGLFRQSFAGDIVNTLYYASKLGLKTSFLSSLGSDSFTDDLVSFLDAASIDHSNCDIIKGKNNGLYIIRTDQSGEPKFTFFRSTSAAREAFNTPRTLGHTSVIMCSAIGLAVFHGRENYFKTLESAGTGSLVYFDLNVRESLWSDLNELVLLLRRLGSTITILSLSRSDDEKLFGHRDIDTILSCYQDLGFKHCILRDGADDVHIMTGTKIETVSVEAATTVVDATGAGDAFNAGYIYGLLNNFETIHCAELACRSAREVLGARGGIVSTFSPVNVLPQV
ncbi:MAG TPA: sugar kinase [Candidatus Kapabacteria bacterium]|nr:sugar kinase [Candidatus Kapabacteria bacterium]